MQKKKNPAQTHIYQQFPQKIFSTYKQYSIMAISNIRVLHFTFQSSPNINSYCTGHLSRNNINIRC